MAIAGFVFVPAIYWTNTWNTAYLPINTNQVYDNTGNTYNISRVLNADFSLDVAAYEAYSPAYLGASNAFLYGAFFAVYTATMMYVVLYHGKEIWSTTKATFKNRNVRGDHHDVHNRLMSAYKECPEWWYLALVVVAFVLSVVCNEVYNTSMPVWGIVFALGLCLLTQIPIGIA